MSLGAIAVLEDGGAYPGKERPYALFFKKGFGVLEVASCSKKG